MGCNPLRRGRVKRELQEPEQLDKTAELREASSLPQGYVIVSLRDKVIVQVSPPLGMENLYTPCPREAVSELLIFVGCCIAISL